MDLDEVTKFVHWIVRRSTSSSSLRLQVLQDLALGVDDVAAMVWARMEMGDTGMSRAYQQVKVDLLRQWYRRGHNTPELEGNDSMRPPDYASVETHSIRSAIKDALANSTIEERAYWWEEMVYAKPESPQGRLVTARIKQRLKEGIA